MLHVVIYSGGLDSFTLLHHVARNIQMQPPSIAAREHILAISFDYGQRHRKELEYAKAECARMGIVHDVIRLESAIRRGNSALTFGAIPVPHGHYEDATMKQTVVPGRNTIMLSVAMGWAESTLNCMAATEGAQVYYGAHSGDHHIYPDCRPDFVYHMADVFRVATDGRVRLNVPFLHGNKKTILQQGFADGLKLEDYARSWTCYEGGEHPCGKCGACGERLEAFASLGLEDPGFAGKNKS